MSSDPKDWPYHLACTEDFKRQAERIAALSGLDSWRRAIVNALDLALLCAESSVKGDTAVVFCKPEVASLIQDNQRFIEALCEEGVVEWLTPFVLTKSKQDRT